ncbi:MAG: bifunctional heptose 7-phosphate kinase/heptose 1-phosphate adenyltransferase [Nanoarchaeota archaeon]
MAKIALIGDIMLDIYYYTANRNNPESSAPAHIVSKNDIRYLPGGAGNVAANFSSLNSDFSLISLIGKDSYAGILIDSFNSSHISYDLIFDSNINTIVKSRIIDKFDKHYHCRLDIEDKIATTSNHINEIISKVRDADLIVISDYNKGVVNEDLMIRLRKLNIPIIVDPKPEHKDLYKNVFLIKPNSDEARRMIGIDDDLKAGEYLMKTLNANILLSRSEKGMSFFGLLGDRFNFPAQPNGELKDVTGAGDSVVAAFAHFFAKRRNLEDCVRLANKAGGIAVCHSGCYHVREAELLD